MSERLSERVSEWVTERVRDAWLVERLNEWNYLSYNFRGQLRVFWYLSFLCEYRSNRDAIILCQLYPVIGSKRDGRNYSLSICRSIRRSKGVSLRWSLYLKLFPAYPSALPVILLRNRLIRLTAWRLIAWRITHIVICISIRGSVGLSVKKWQVCTFVGSYDICYITSGSKSAF